MVLREITRNIIGLVESVSRCPVVMSEDVPRENLAASRIARGANRVQALANSAGKVDTLIVWWEDHVVGS